MVGKTLKHFRIDGVLGEGGMGVVYRSQDTRLQRAVALKLLSSELTADADRRKRFFQEARAAARITHPSIAQVYDVDEQNGITFIAMELVEGKTVRDLVRARELDLLGSIDIAIQVAEGLAKAHEIGIIHRDIKPANVILTRDGHVKILDFGLAKLMDRAAPPETTSAGTDNLSTLTQTQVGAVMGTAAYMSPEQVKGVGVDHRSDLFSLGVMLFEMATFELPFQRSSALETMHAVAFDEMPSIHSFRPNLPVELQRIISRCLRKRPEDRYPDARALVHELKVLRRDTEAGKARTYSLRERFADAVDRVQHLRPSEYVWIAGGVVGLSLVLYLVLRGINVAGVFFLALGGLYLYRFVRNRPRRMLELFVRRVSRIPEVKVISAREESIAVLVDRASGQLYGRINAQVNFCNKKIFLGKPMSVTIRQETTPEEMRRIVESAGVQFVRDDVLAGPSRK